MSGFDPDQARDANGMWARTGSSPRRSVKRYFVEETKSRAKRNTLAALEAASVAATVYGNRHGIAAGAHYLETGVHAADSALKIMKVLR